MIETNENHFFLEIHSARKGRLIKKIPNRQLSKANIFWICLSKFIGNYFVELKCTTKNHNNRNLKLILPRSSSLCLDIILNTHFPVC